MKSVDGTSLMYGVEEYIGARNLLCVENTTVILA